MDVFEVDGTEPLGNGKYKIYVELGRDSFGKRRRRTKTVTPTSERNLRNLKRDFEIECHLEKDEPIENVTFKGFVKKWWENHVEVNLKENTSVMYEHVLNNDILDYFGNMKLKEIRRFHIVEYLNRQKTLAPNKYVVLKSIFKHSVIWEVITDNPTDNVESPVYKTKKKVAYYTEDEIKHLINVLDKVNPKHRIMIKLAVLGGLRRSEVAGIREESINYEESYIHVNKQLVYKKGTGLFLDKPKNKKSRKVYFPPKFMKELKTYVTELKARKMAMGNAWNPLIIDGEPVNLIIVRDDGYPTNPQSITKEWVKIIKRHDLKHITFHQLRHSCASVMVKQGINFKIIQERLGHSNIAITLDRYSHLETDQHIAGAEVFSHLL